MVHWTLRGSQPGARCLSNTVRQPAEYISTPWSSVPGLDLTRLPRPSLLPRQGSPDFMDKMYDIATSFVDIFTYVRNNVGRVSGGHRHLLQANSAQPSAADIAKAVVSACVWIPAPLVVLQAHHHIASLFQQHGPCKSGHASRAYRCSRYRN